MDQYSSLIRRRQGYTTVEASNGATLEAKWEFKRNIRPWSRSLYVGVVKDFLAPGDTITIRFGDRRFGSPGIRLQTYCESEFEFRVFADPIATYDYVALPESPRSPSSPARACTGAPYCPRSCASARRSGCRSRPTTNGATHPISSIATLRFEADGAIAGLPATVRFAPGPLAQSMEGLHVAKPGDVIISVLDESGNVLCRSNPMRVVAKDAALVHFWGDTHGQSNETLGTNTAREYFEFGRNKAFLDVMGHQGNDFQITGEFWRELNALSKEFDEPGRFVCIPGYEWSANTAVGGDRNVHYRHEGETIHRSSHAQIADAIDMADEASDAHTAHELFAKLEGKDCVVMAHVGGRYADIKYAHDPHGDRRRGAFGLGHVRMDCARRLREELPRRHRGQLRRPQGPPGRVLSGRLVLRQLRRIDLLPRRAARPRRDLRIACAAGTTTRRPATAHC